MIASPLAERSKKPERQAPHFVAHVYPVQQLSRLALDAPRFSLTFPKLEGLAAV